jgi:hypothetical protein
MHCQDYPSELRSGTAFWGAEIKAGLTGDVAGAKSPANG